MPRTVLVVDDHDSFRAVARSLLELEGYDVIGEASGAAEAVRAASALRPDVLLVDIGLPDGDGFAVADAVSAQAGSPPVVLMSNRDGADFPRRLAACGAAGFIAKHELSGAALRGLVG
jgi:DNA-binding NarL/FixJ family response regulator